MGNFISSDTEFRRRRSFTVEIVFFDGTYFGIEFSEHFISRISLMISNFLKFSEIHGYFLGKEIFHKK